MKTAVEWLIDMLVTENEITLKGENYKLFDQAKEMEKEQLINAVESTINSFELTEDKTGFFTMGGEGYYNETFKTN